MEFNVDSLFADTQSVHAGPLSQRAESTDGGGVDGASKMGRWFQLENSPTTAKSLPPQLEQQAPVLRPPSRQDSGQQPSETASAVLPSTSEAQLQVIFLQLISPES